MVKGGRRFCRAGDSLLVVLVVVDAGMAMDGVSRLNRRIRVARLCSEHGMRIAVEHLKMSSSIAVLNRLVQSVETIIVLRYAKALISLLSASKTICRWGMALLLYSCPNVGRRLGHYCFLI